MKTTRRMTVDSELIRFGPSLVDQNESLSPFILLPKAPERSTLVIIQPSVPFQLTALEFVPDSDDLDVAMVQVGNVLCAPFAKRHRPCDIGTNIAIMVTYRGERPIQTRVRLSGIGLVEQQSEG
jgi:hypothetical protein